MDTQSQLRAGLARQLFSAVATPIVLLILLGIVLGHQILQMSEDSRWVDHTDQVIATVSETSQQILDQETAVRGFGLTSDRAFLEPAERAHPRDGFARLHDLVADNPAQQARFEEARVRYEIWFESVASVLKNHDVAGAKNIDAMDDRKLRMDRVRDAMRTAVDVEIGLRRERATASAASIATTRVVFVVLFAASAITLAFLSRRQLGAIAGSFGAALASETAAREATEREAWIRAGQTKLSDALQGERTIDDIATESLAILAEYARADVGAFFTKEHDGWRRRGGFALDPRAAGPETFADGEGIVGRAAIAGKVVRLQKVPPDYLKLRSGTGEGSPVELVVIPARVDGGTNAIVELGFLRPADARTLELLDRIGQGLALAVRSAEYKHQLRELLEESQRQTEELQMQQEELRVANEELEAQTTALKIAREELETQQAELAQTNDNLVEQSTLLEQQNQRLAETQADIAAKAGEVERASQFKSEFLSNMSHELRTPLNSSLILAKLLADNKDGNLSDEQVSFAETIYGAGNDLLTLINDILDLSKVESGKMEIRVASVSMEHVRASLLRTFEPVAHSKKLRFAVQLDASAPQMLETDPQRLEQILRNLVSNALKFTERGEVVVDVAQTGDRITFAVRDTGIGIPKADQALIFDAFRQADGTTNRKFGGTGLGLSISRELARLLGGEVSVTSESAKGSTFTLMLPRVFTGAKAPSTSVNSAHLPPSPPLRPSRTDGPMPDSDHGEIVLEEGRRLVLVIEDDPTFANILADVAREAGFQCAVATTAQRGLEVARKYAPIGVVLDMKLPDHSGLSVLDRLKRDPATRHIPVHVISAADYVETALSMGAAGYLLKPAKREQLAEAIKTLEMRANDRMRRVLVVDDDVALREAVAKLLDRDDIEISTAASASEALAMLRERPFDCIVTDLGLPDRSGFELLEAMATEVPYSVPPVIVYTGRALSADDEQVLRKYSRSIIVKGARSPERLLDEVTLFLHQVESKLPPDQQRLLKQARHREAVFEGRTILIVEDDVRSVFALTSVLEPKGARAVIARNGKEALAVLEKEPRVDLVLMDVMMPEMDGLEATRQIRKNPKWAKLPVISLTAKAMKDDHERCLAAGANDYLAKPIDVEMLLSLLRVWMPKT